MRAFVFVAMLGLAAAYCPNACSGNGICGAQAKCSCHQNWQGADCSQRTCPFTLAWADTADGTNQAHYYAECGNKGICDRKVGECKCFDGYEGKGCRRSTCPESCSAHGTCEYIEELAGDFADRRNGPGFKYKTLTCTSQLDSDPNTGAETSCSDAAAHTSNVVARSANTDHYHGHIYQLWDAGKIQGCKCDLGYKGADCSTREVPRGDDPLTTVKAETQKQFIQIDQGTFAAGDQFFMRYHDPYGGSWVTNSIPFEDDGSDAGDAVVAADVQAQLRGLPNGVLSDVSVAAVLAASGNQKTCHRFYDGVQHISAYDQTTDGNYQNSKGATNKCHVESVSALGAAADTVDFTVTMGNQPGQTGVQHMLEVELTPQTGGAFPISTGASSSSTVTIAEINYNDNLGNLSELAECSDRGLDDGEGQCECFDGYRGLSCEEQEALV